MRELRDLRRRLRELGERQTPGALATIVAVEGSSYRREGARMLLEPDGRMTGVLSGGCIESDLLGTAKTVLADGVARVVHFDLMADAEAIWGFGLGCAGRITLVVEPLGGETGAGEVLEATLAASMDRRHEARLASRISAIDSTTDDQVKVERWLGEIDRPAECATKVPREGKQTVGRKAATDTSGAARRPELPVLWSFFSNAAPNATEPANGAMTASSKPDPHVLAQLTALPCESAVVVARANGGGGSLRWLLESILPPVQLLLIGVGRDAVPVARLAAEMGWEVTLVDPRPTGEAAARYAGLGRYVGEPPRRLADVVTLDGRTAAVVGTHRYLDDLAFLGELATSAVGYLAVLGPRQRKERLLGDLARQGHGPRDGALATLRGPAGFALGGRSPEEVALAIVAEVQAVMSGRRAEALSELASRPSTHGTVEVP